MKKYEREIKRLIELTNGGCEPVHQKITGLTEDELRFLAAKKLLRLQPAGDNMYFVTVEPAGLTYFSDKREATGDFIKEHIATFLSGFFSGVLVTVIASWIVQAVL